MHRLGRLYVLSAPSGGGKTTLCNRLLETTPTLVRSVSVTTRSPRRGERDGKDYFFVTREEFQRLKKKRGLLEWTEYARSFYGTPLGPLRESLAEGKDVILLLDIRGAEAVKKRFKDATTIFLLPPSRADLKRRLVGRKTEKKPELLKRLQLAEGEMRVAARYDYVVVNDDLNRALHTLKRIVKRDR